MKELIIIIGADCDPDIEENKAWKRNTLNDYRHNDYWNGIKKGIPALKEYLTKVQPIIENPVKFTWCVRCDFQIKDVYGLSEWCLNEFFTLWKNLEKEGDEIGWHLHLLRWNPDYKMWYQEIRDSNWIQECISESFAAFKKVWGKPPTSSRMGWVFHNNITIKKISSLGIKLDFSAIPGLSKTIVSKKDNIRDYADWKRASSYPYHPSNSDYQVSSQEEKNLAILEVPCLSLSSYILMLPYNFKSLLSRKGVILKKPVFPAMITTLPLLFKKAFNCWLNIHKTSNIGFLATYFHPAELLTLKKEFLIRNLLYLKKFTNKHNIKLRFVTASQAYEILKVHGNNYVSK